MKVQKIDKNYLKNLAEYNKKRQKGLSPFCYLNPDAGNVEKGTEVFNSSTGDVATTSLGESVDDYDTESEKQQIFNKIQMINPNADYDNYKKKSVRQMLAILNNYQDKSKKRLVNKPKQVEFTNKNNYNNHDIYYDADSDDYMIKGLNIGFSTEEEAREYIKDLNSDD